MSSAVRETHQEARSGRGTGGADRGRATVILFAVVVGVLLGPLDLAGQVHTPYPFANLFNSPAVWATGAFFFGRWVADIVPALVGAIVAMGVGVEMYYVADVVVRGANTSTLWSPVALVWLMLGVGAGLGFGAAGSLSTRKATWTGAVAAATLPAVFAAEAAHAATKSNEGGWILLLIALAVVTVVWLLRRADRTSFQRTVLSIAAWTALGYTAYLPFG